ncbi:hypothetical protein RFI_09428, partial [Reticulomyxa filosa]
MCLLKCTAQLVSNGESNRCLECIATAGYENPELYDFTEEDMKTFDKSCWDACIGSKNTFLGTGDMDTNEYAKSMKGIFFEAQFADSSNVDLELTHTFDRNLEVVMVSRVTAYSHLTGELIDLGDNEVAFVHGTWFRRYANPSANEWLSPFHNDTQIETRFAYPALANRACFTWVASKDGVTGNFGAFDAIHTVDKAGVESWVSNDDTIEWEKEAGEEENVNEISTSESAETLTEETQLGRRLASWSIPTKKPTMWWNIPTKKPTKKPTMWWNAPTKKPTMWSAPTKKPTMWSAPTKKPTMWSAPTKKPTMWWTTTGKPSQQEIVTTKSPTRIQPKVQRIHQLKVQPKVLLK